jgi:hypothetical protein
MEQKFWHQSLWSVIPFLRIADFKKGFFFLSKVNEMLQEHELHAKAPGAS